MDKVIKYLKIAVEELENLRDRQPCSRIGIIMLSEDIDDFKNAIRILKNKNLKTPISMITFSETACVNTRIKFALRREGVEYMEQINLNEIDDVRNIGEKSIKAIKEKYKEFVTKKR